MLRKGIPIVLAVLLIAQAPIQNPLSSHSAGQSKDAKASNSQGNTNPKKNSANYPLVADPTTKSKNTRAKAAANTSASIDKWFYGWTLSDKIAAIASLAALAQFMALLATVCVMDRSAKRQLRAYVWVRATDLLDFNVGSVPFVKLQIRNAGQTPAYDMQVFAGCIVCNTPLPQDMKFPTVGAKASVTKMVLHPGTEPPYELQATFGLLPELGQKRAGLNQEQYNGLVDGDQVRLHVFAHVAYKDAFNVGRDTYFCVSVDATDAKKGQSPFKVNFVATELFNTST